MKTYTIENDGRDMDFEVLQNFCITMAESQGQLSQIPDPIDPDRTLADALNPAYEVILKIVNKLTE